MSFLAVIYLFLQKYLIPFLFSIGLFYFLYGLIEYFIIGKGGDEERSEHGRELFLKSIAWLVVALVAFAFVSIIGWVSTLSFPSGDLNAPQGGAGVDFNRNQDILEVPNVPTR